MRRFDRLKTILALDPEQDCDEIYRLLSQYEFPWDFTRSLELALFRTYAVPTIGRLLDRTGEFTRCTQKRYDDTVLVLYEILLGDSARDREQALDHLNQIHWRYRISNEDYLYTLATFVVMPVRWINEFGWRRLHPNEIQALTRVWSRMGEGMRIEGIPGTYEEFERLLDDYERERFAFDEGGRRVAESTMRLFGSWFPRPLSATVSDATRLLMDPHLLDALHLPRPPQFARRAVELALKARGQFLRLGSPPRPDSRPVTPSPATYPGGYRLHDLGPASFHRKPTRRDAPPPMSCPVTAEPETTTPPQLR
ncbi:oxygenase MpaB family protein [Saccharopolyspora tripterygii]